MSSRLNSVYSQSDPWRPIVAELQSIRSDLTALHSSQRVSGAGGLLNYRTSTDSTWDFTGTRDTTSGDSHMLKWVVTFTGDGTQKFPAEMCTFDLFIDQVDEAHRMSPSQPNYGANWELSLGEDDWNFNIVEKFVISNPAFYSDPYRWQWTIYVSAYNIKFSYWFKATALGTCGGTLTVTEQWV